MRGTGAIGGTFVVQQIPNQSTGTGVINPFVRINPGGGETSEQGFNTDARPLQFNENSSPTFTHALSLSAIPVINLSVVLYRQFLLDINQTNANPLLDLNQIQIFLSNSGSDPSTGLTAATATTPPVIQFAGLTEVFRMNNASSTLHDIRLDYSLNAGSGSGDMFLYVLDAVFDAVFTAGFTNVILYSQFGLNPGPNRSNDGFEEWATLNGVT